MATRGRPQLAAATLDEALRAVASNTAPKRPRNEFERIAGGKAKGRTRSANSKTSCAAELAAYLMKTEDIPQAAAVNRASGAFMPPVDRSNIRRYLKRMSPTVLLPYSPRQAMHPEMHQLVSSSELHPILAFSVDYQPGDDAEPAGAD